MAPSKSRPPQDSAAFAPSSSSSDEDTAGKATTTRAKGKGKAKANDDYFDDEEEDEEEDEEDEDDIVLPKSRKKRGDYGEGSDKPRKRTKKGDSNYAWEASYNRSWDAVQEDESGGLQAAVEGLLARGRRRKAQSSKQTSLRRSIIRHLYILFDLSSSMTENDLRPNRFDLTLMYLRSFVVEWFDQNPLGQIGIIGLRSGIGEMIIEMGGNPHAIITAIVDKHKLTPAGEPSLQNGLEMARSSMSHLPSTSSLEILVLFSSLTTTDPGNISKTTSSLASSKIKVSIISLAAELKVCRTITEKTGGRFGVALNEQHYKELIWEAIQAPATVGSMGIQNAMDRVASAHRSAAGAAGGAGTGSKPPADLMMMGFPTRLALNSKPSLCACHSLLKQGGYECPRCGAKICEVPTDCEVCGLMVVSSPHLARSYWFLFPVALYDTVAIEDVLPTASPSCHACDVPFPESTATEAGVANVEEGVSSSGRYRCQKCKNDFCMECDLFVHDVLHSCPGCA